MAISVDPSTYIITIPRTDLALIQSTPTEIRELSLNTFRSWLNDWEDDPDGMPHPKTHDHNTEVTVGGLTLARVISILEPYTITFEDGQYAVNLTGANSNVGDRINVNQVSVRSSNSAGMVTSQAIEYGEYGGGVTIDVTSAYSGAIYPVGTPRQPVNNLSDAKQIGGARGFHHFFVVGDLTIGATDNIDDYELDGEGASFNSSKTTITLTSGCSTSNTTFHNCRIEGVQGGECNYTDCIIGTVTETHCQFKDCGMVGQITMNEGAWTSTHTTSLQDCYTSDAWYVLDYNASPIQQIYTNFSGRIKIINFTHASATLHLQLDAGEVWFDSTCTNGNAVITGVGTLIDDSTSTIDTHGLMSQNTVATAVSDKVSNLQQLIESNQHSPAFGNIYFRDPINGNDGNDGLTKATPVLTFTASLALMASGNRDICFIINTSGSAMTMDEQWVINKSNVTFRAASYDDFKLVPTATTTPTIDVTAGGVGLQGIKVQTSLTDGGANDQYCIRYADGTNGHHLKGCKIARGFDGGIILMNNDGMLVEQNIIEHMNNSDGVLIDVYGNSHENVFVDNFMYDGTTAFRFNDTSEENWIKGRNLLHDLVTGIRIEDATVGHLYVDRDTAFENLTNELSDAGGSGIHLLRDNDNADIADAVWDEDLTTHTITDSAGKKLTDIPDEATFTI